jgi:CRP-like cAMP-binding protein
MVMWGRVKVSQVSRTGDEVILRVQGSGEVIGGLGMLPGESHSSTIRALEACQVAELEGGRFSLAMRALSGTATECAADHE